MTWTGIIIFTIIVCVIAGVGEYRAQRKANELPFTDFSPVTPAEEADRREAGGLAAIVLELASDLIQLAEWLDKDYTHEVFRKMSIITLMQSGDLVAEDE